MPIRQRRSSVPSDPQTSRPEPGAGVDAFLGHISSLIHVGANDGMERRQYAKHGLDVLWVEALPECFDRLEHNLRDYPKQTAVRALVTDKDGGEYQFNVANNVGSSSIFEFHRHREIWPHVHSQRKLPMTSVTLPTLMAGLGGGGVKYEALVMDTQGSELLVLRGAESILGQFSFIKTEVADFEAYRGCCQLADMEEFLAARRFRRLDSRCFAKGPGGESYYDVTYVNCERGGGLQPPSP